MKELLKRSRTLHSAYKLSRRFPEAPLSAWTDMRRTRSIFRVLPNTMLSAPRLINAYECMRAVEEEGLAGDVAECGVWAGGGIGLMATVSRSYGSERRFHLFDSFEGMPQPSEHDLEVVDGFRSEHPEVELDAGSTDGLVAIDACAAPLTAAKHLFFDVLKFDERQVVIHQGWFQETVAAAAPEIGPLAILRIDGDWYESTKVCLEHLYDQVVPGGAVIIDDYGSFSGCRKAVDEFLAARGIDVSLEVIDHDGRFFRKPASASGDSSPLHAGAISG
jgi:O-methyltransferase